MQFRISIFSARIYHTQSIQIRMRAHKARSRCGNPNRAVQFSNSARTGLIIRTTPHYIVNKQAARPLGPTLLFSNVDRAGVPVSMAWLGIKYQISNVKYQFKNMHSYPGEQEPTLYIEIEMQSASPYA